MGDNFYRAINADWLRTTVLPPTETRVTQAYFIQKEIDRQTGLIIQKEVGPVKDFIQSWTAAEGRIPIGFSSLIQLMMSINSLQDLSSRIGWMNRYGISAPLAIYIQGDPRDHKRCRIFIEEGEPRIGIPEYWLEKEFAGHRKAYDHYITRLAAITGLPELVEGFTSEREFAKVFPSVLDRKVRINMSTWSELNREFRQIDWTALLMAWGLDAKVLPDLVYNVTSSAFLHHLQNRMVRWSLDRWRSWMALLVTQWIAGISPHGPLRSAWFDYNHRYLQGSEVDDTAENLKNAVIRTVMPNRIGKLWVQEYCNPQVRRDVVRMVEKIRDAAANCLKTADWMALATRNAAIRKLHAMEIQVGWPDMKIWEPLIPACGLSGTSLIENLMSLSKASSDFNQELLKGGSCRHPLGKLWGKPVFVVNAYYYPDENRFILPAAILNPPFYDIRKSHCWNYGAIGATIGHELCHGFDSDGRSYDEHGDKHDWWKKKDDKEYRSKAKAVVRLYDKQLYRGKSVDGELTLIENIADIGGLEFSLTALKTVLGRPLTKMEKREFFTSYAVSWRSKDRLKRAVELLVTDVHAPPMTRVNEVVRQFDEWYEAFDIDEHSTSWIAPENRIHFFRE